jgi:hypothetical protein
VKTRLKTLLNVIFLFLNKSIELLIESSSILGLFIISEKIKYPSVLGRKIFKLKKERIQIEIIELYAIKDSIGYFA